MKKTTKFLPSNERYHQMRTRKSKNGSFLLRREEWQLLLCFLSHRLQSEECKKELLQREPILCGYCMKEKNYDNKTTIEWIQCDECSVWLHLSCTIPKLASIPEQYTCEFCRQNT